MRTIAPRPTGKTMSQYEDCVSLLGIAPRIADDPEAISVVPQKSGELNRSMQHWLEVYSPGFQSPGSFGGVDLGAELPC